MRFDCAVAGAPWCTPFRGALLSGLYPHQTGVVANGVRLPPELPTVATAFNDAGYHTAYVGKWHLDGTNDPDHYVPPERRGGFRCWVGNEASNATGRRRNAAIVCSPSGPRRPATTSRCRTSRCTNAAPRQSNTGNSSPPAPASRRPDHSEGAAFGGVGPWPGRVRG